MEEPTILVALDTAVQSELAMLIARGYSYRGITAVDGGSLVGPYLEAQLENRNNQRTILVEYFPRSEKAPENLALVVKRFRHESVNLRAFLEYTQAGASIETIQLSHYVGSSAERIRSCLSAMRAVLESGAQTLLSGQEWPSIPFNWQGLK